MMGRRDLVSALRTRASRAAFTGTATWALFFLAACGREDQPASSQPEQRVEDGEGDHVLALDVYESEHRIHVLTAQKGDAGALVLMHVVSDDDGGSWSEPIRVNATLPPPQSPSRGNDPQIAARRETIMAVWTPPGTDAWGGGPLVAALSNDGGRTWREGKGPAAAASSVGQYYIELSSDSAGAFHLIWLEDRDGSRGLRYARSDDAKHWSIPTTVDAATCECCWNALAASDHKVYALYRDRSPRDMALAFSADHGATWRRVGPVGAFDWNVDACPHSGGRLVRNDGADLHAIVSTGKRGMAGLHHLRSRDDGERWSPTHRIAGDRANHPDMALRNGVLAAAWDAWTGSEIAIHYSLSSDGGEHWSTPRQLSKAGATATHPRVLATRSGFRIFWSERGKDASAVWSSAAVAAGSRE